MQSHTLGWAQREALKRLGRPYYTDFIKTEAFQGMSNWMKISFLSLFFHFIIIIITI